MFGFLKFSTKIFTVGLAMLMILVTAIFTAISLTGNNTVAVLATVAVMTITNVLTGIKLIDRIKL